MKTLLKSLVLGSVILGLFSASAAAGRGGDNDADIRKLPGYVDFNSIDLFKNREAKVEVNLKGPMLQLVSKFAKYDEKGEYDVLSRLKLVNVHIFDIDHDTAKKFSEASRGIAAQLDKKGWERIVRVRDEGDHVDVYFKPSHDYEWIDGIVVMVVGDDDEAVFVNVVGQIRPEDIGRLGGQFGIHELEGIDSTSIHKRH